MLLFASAALASPIPADSTQLILGIAPGWDSSTVRLIRYTRTDTGWQAVGEPIDGRLGREGLAWGIGLHPPQEGAQKQEGDWRAPAGVFALGDAFGDALLSPVPDWPMQEVTPRTLWVEDAGSPDYNRLVVVPGEDALSDWQEGQRMRLGDDAHRLKLVVEHNTAPPLPGAGSAIFFHIWRRDGATPTAGCTAMSAGEMEGLIRWLQPAASPVYVLLPAPVYTALSEPWGLPEVAGESGR